MVIDILSRILNSAQVIKDFLSIYSYNSQIDELLVTVSNMETLLLQVVDSPHLSEEQRLWITELKEALYEAALILKNITIRVEQCQLAKAGGGLSENVRCFRVAYDISLDIQEIGNKLDAIIVKSFDHRKSSLSNCFRSFDHLKSSLSNCFSYCDLFPKDFEIQTEKLKGLWMAQGYTVVPPNEGQSIEDVCEEYLSILFSSSRFKDIKKDKYGQIASCKINDDLSKQAAEDKEILVMNTICHNLDKDVRHVSVVGVKFDEYTLGKTEILSYLHLGYDDFQVKKSYLESLVTNYPNLKALDLSGLIFESLPDSVGSLLQLRYLDISGNTMMKFLPKSIRKLINLQTLILRRCHMLKEFPDTFMELVNLRVLDIRHCFSLTRMPLGMSDLTCLHSLSDYIVDAQSDTSWYSFVYELKALQYLNNLRGSLKIQVRWPKIIKKVVKEAGRQEGLGLVNTPYLNVISVDFVYNKADCRVKNDEARRLMELLHPHKNLKYLEVKKYHGMRMPDWVTLLPKLVELHLTDCMELEYLPYLGDLFCLKVLRLVKLVKLQWIGKDSALVDSSSAPMTQLLSYLPPLETLEISNLPKLKGWRSGVENGHQFLNPGRNNSRNNGFSELKTLYIWNCPELTCFPPCPKMEILTLLNINSGLEMIINFEGGVVIPYESSSSWSPHPENSTAIKKMTISNVSWLSTVPAEAFQSLECLDIWDDKKLGSLGDAENVFIGCSSSLKHLIIRNCCTLSNVVLGGLEHLSALEMLEIRDCNELRLSEQQQQGVECLHSGISFMPCSSNLHTLTLQGLPQLMNLPNWMQNLPALHSLNISFCNQLKSMPNWMPKLTSLTHLKVSGCSTRLKKRCQENPPGEDWPFIQYIPNIQFQECFYYDKQR